MPLAVSARAVLRAHFCAWLKQSGIFELISRSLAPRARRRLLISVDQITDILRRKVPPSLANHGEALCQAGSRRGTVCRIHTVLNPCAAIRAPIQFSSFACYQVSAALLKTRHVLIGRVGPSSPMLWGRPQPRVMQRPLVRVARDFLVDQLLGAIGCSRSCQEVSPPQLRPRRTQSLFCEKAKPCCKI